MSYQISIPEHKINDIQLAGVTYSHVCKATDD
jgi:hypothetical protein